MKILSNDYLSNVPLDSRVAPGGPAHFAYAFSEEVIKHGHEWIGIIHQGKDEVKTSIQKKAGVKNKTYYFFSYPPAHRQTFMASKKMVDPRKWFALQIDVLRKFIRRVKPDVLFLNGYSVFAWQLLEAARLENLPIVIQHAGISQVEFEQYKDLYTHAARMSVLQMERDIVAAASKQVFLNAYSRDAFCERVAPVPAKQAVIIPLPYQKLFLKSAASSRSKKSSSHKTVVVGCVARWDRIKNHAAILRLAEEARKQNLDWYFKCVTKIPETTVHRRFKNAYKKAIEVVPPMSAQDLINFYNSVDLLVLPSHFDVSPTVVMEAALQGKVTLISPNVGWVSEYLAHGLDEWIIDFTDPKQVVQRMSKLLRKSDPTGFRVSIRTKHNPNKVFAAYLRLLNSVI